MQLGLPLQVPEPRRVGAADVDHQVVGQRAQHPHALQVIGPRVLGQLVLPQVNAQRKADYKTRMSHTQRGRVQTATRRHDLQTRESAGAKAADVLNGTLVGMGGIRQN